MSHASKGSGESSSIARLMNWIPLEREEQLNEINRISSSKPQLIFKHSTRCSISTMAKSRLERSEIPTQLDFYYLDLIAYRSLSNKISEIYHVHHESPQVLLIKNGECVFDESHNAIDINEIAGQAIL